MHHCLRVVIGLVTTAAILCGGLSAGRAADGERQAAYVEIHSAIQDFLVRFGQKENLTKDELDGMRPLAWEASDLGGGSETLRQWLASHPYGGQLRITTTWELEPSPAAIAGLEEKLGRALSRADLRSMSILTATATVSARLSRRGWHISEPTQGDTASEVYPFSRTSEQGFHPQFLDYLTSVNGAAEIRSLQQGTPGIAMAYRTVDAWDVLETRGGSAEFKWGPCGIGRLGEFSVFEFDGPNPQNPGVKIGRLTQGRMAFCSYAVEQQAYQVEASQAVLRWIEADFTLDCKDGEIVLQVFRGSVNAECRNAEETVTEGQGFSSARGVFTLPGVQRPDWAADELFAPALPLIDGKFNFAADETAYVNMHGIHNDDRGSEFSITDNLRQTGARFDPQYGNLSAVVELPAGTLLDEIRVLAGSGSLNDITTTEYIVELSTTGSFKGEEVVILRDAFSSTADPGRPTHVRAVKIPPQEVRFLRYHVTQCNNAPTVLFELQALGAPPARTDLQALREPWLFPRDAMRDLRPKALLTGIRQIDKSPLQTLLDNKTDGLKADFSGDGGELRLDLSEPRGFSAVSLYTRVKSQGGERQGGGQTFAIEVSPTGQYQGEEKRLLVGTLPRAGRSTETFTVVDPVKSRYVRVLFLAGADKSISVFHVELLAPAFLRSAEGAIVPFTAESPFTPQESQLPVEVTSVSKLPVTEATSSDAANAGLLGLATDANPATSVTISGASSQTVFHLQAPSAITSILMYASSGSTAQKSTVHFVLESSPDGAFAGEETILATGMFEGIASLDAPDYFQRFNLARPALAQHLRLRVTFAGAEGIRLHEMTIEGGPAAEK